MSFGASAKRARDSSRPLGLRVACLHECLERFSVFGYHSTRNRLRHRVGASDPGWTEQQLLDALGLLESAKQSWSAFHDEQLAQQRTLKRLDHNASRPTLEALVVAWREQYMDSGQDQLWLVSDVGECTQCGHRLIHHGGYACEGCGFDPQVEWNRRCRVQLLEFRPD
jgi:hypothetical protein